MRLADEQMTLCEVKKQQLKVLDDQQKVYADDLTKSVIASYSLCNETSCICHDQPIMLTNSHKRAT